MNIGLYGGTFSPPHIAHVRAARLFIERAELDRLLVMPAGIPPHKQADKWGSADHRLEMTRLAFGSFAEISEYEIAKEGRSYTVETLRYLREKCPSDKLFMLVGEDMFLSLEQWREPAEIMKLCTVVAMRRADMPASVMETKKKELEEAFGANIILMEADPLELSSTEVREKTAKGEDTKALLPDAVYEYIKEHGLYRNDS
ncbi:MAG: nicotinate-nucleotide adenylyltransferase [Clostridia bacterium]|nr:nicotinate-nucleotide adenylyltransferase [Clostridia bacterium]